MNLLLIAGGRDGLDFHSVGEFRDAVGHVAVADVQTLDHDVVVAVVLRSDLDFGVFHLVVLADGVDEFLVLHLAHARLRNDDGRSIVGRDDDNTATTALQQALGVLEGRNDLERARRSVDYATHLRHLARVVVNRAVGQLQFHGRKSRNRSLRRATRLRHRQQVLLRHREIDLHRRVVRHRCQRGIAP